MGSCDLLKLVIRADKKPIGEHRGRFNAPTTNEVAAIIVNQDQGAEMRDIVLKKKMENYTQSLRHTDLMTLCNIH